ncbi:hypothetical protein BKA61DRAFT_574452 [Leptodontidium sp. MPI-SDFR-AT-0119]|nr:hypothetical protein BKA61DRAFT_574452 [Leptodontidium sp. MPI-SDFR-AT-0119]
MEPKLDAEPKDNQSNSDKNLDDSTTRTSLETTWKVGEDLQARTCVIWWIQMKGYKYNNNNHPYQIHQMQTILYPSIGGTIWTLKLLLLLIQMPLGEILTTARASSPLEASKEDRKDSKYCRHRTHRQDHHCNEDHTMSSLHCWRQTRLYLAQRRCEPQPHSLNAFQIPPSTSKHTIQSLTSNEVKTTNKGANPADFLFRLTSDYQITPAIPRPVLGTTDISPGVVEVEEERQGSSLERQVGYGLLSLKNSRGVQPTTSRKRAASLAFGEHPKDYLFIF